MVVHHRKEVNTMTQEQWEKEQEETPKHAGLLGMMCFGMIAGAFCTMKNIRNTPG